MVYKLMVMRFIRHDLKDYKMQSWRKHSAYHRLVVVARFAEALRRKIRLVYDWGGARHKLSK